MTQEDTQGDAQGETQDPERRPQRIFEPQEITHEACKDADLYKVFVQGTYIGSVRRDGEYWLPIGSFVFRYDKSAPSGMVKVAFRSREEATHELIASWCYQLGHRLTERQERARRREEDHGRKK